MEKIVMIGYGNMAKALISGMIGKYEILVTGRDFGKLKELEKEYESKIKTAQFPISIEGENVILATKPHSISEVSEQLSGKAKTFISVLAGVSVEKLSNTFKAESFIRAMPNLSALFGKSTTSLTGDESGKYLASKIFIEVGSAIWLDSENELDIATAIAGSGPAYLALVAEAMADGGVKSGLKRADAEKFVAGLFNGFAPLINSHKASDIKDGVMSPKGTTASGVAKLEENGVRNAFIKTIESAYGRAVELR
jgi:pyrroline-5-carboxylate reductase